MGKLGKNRWIWNRWIFQRKIRGLWTTPRGLGYLGWENKVKSLRGQRSGHNPLAPPGLQDETWSPERGISSLQDVALTYMSSLVSQTTLLPYSIPALLQSQPTTYIPQAYISFVLSFLLQLNVFTWVLNLIMTPLWFTQRCLKYSAGQIKHCCRSDRASIGRRGK